MVGLILLVILVASLLTSKIQGDENLMNVTIFVMWVMTVLNVFYLFVSDANLRKDYHPAIVVWLTRMLTTLSLLLLIYYGFILAPTIWFVAWIVLHARQYYVNNPRQW